MVEIGHAVMHPFILFMLGVLLGVLISFSFRNLWNG